MNMYASCLDRSLNPWTGCYGYFTTIDLEPVDFKRRGMTRYEPGAWDAGDNLHLTIWATIQGFYFTPAVQNLGACYKFLLSGERSPDGCGERTGAPSAVEGAGK
jgi:hypothetical protein